jgi:hypothetical protein
MNKIDKTELYQHLSGFLKTKGVELKEGSYSRRIEQGCGLLAEAVNLSQQALKRTKSEMDKRLDRMRQIIHEKTAPKTPANPPAPGPLPAPVQPVASRARSRKRPVAKGGASRRRTRG